MYLHSSLNVRKRRSNFCFKHHASFVLQKIKLKLFKKFGFPKNSGYDYRHRFRVSAKTLRQRGQWNLNYVNNKNNEFYFFLSNTLLAEILISTFCVSGLTEKTINFLHPLFWSLLLGDMSPAHLDHGNCNKIISKKTKQKSHTREERGGIEQTLDKLLQESKSNEYLYK